MRFEVGQQYTREEIHDALGGGLTEFLPHKDGRVVAGCFNPELNPEAPRIVAVGPSANAQRWAAVFAEQDEPVPVFLKEGVGRWRYVGDYVVARRVTDPEKLEAHAPGGAQELASLLYLAPVLAAARPARPLAAWAAVAAVGGVAGAGLGLLMERSARAAAFGAGFGAAVGLGVRSAWRGHVLPPRRLR